MNGQGEGHLDNRVTIETGEFHALMQRLKAAEERSRQSEESLARAVQDLENIR